MRSLDDLRGELAALELVNRRWDGRSGLDVMQALQMIADVTFNIHQGRQRDILERIADLKRDADDK